MMLHIVLKRSGLNGGSHPVSRVKRMSLEGLKISCIKWLSDQLCCLGRSELATHQKMNVVE